jgi:hypothetical protein
MIEQPVAIKPVRVLQPVRPPVPWHIPPGFDERTGVVILPTTIGGGVDTFEYIVRPPNRQEIHVFEARQLTKNADAVTIWRDAAAMSLADCLREAVPAANAPNALSRWGAVDEYGGGGMLSGLRINQVAIRLVDPETFGNPDLISTAGAMVSWRIIYETR